MTEAKKLPRRDEIAQEHTWDLRPIFANDAAWSAEFSALEAALPRVEPLRGTLHQSGERLLEALRLRDELAQRVDLVGTYAMLLQSEDLASSRGQAMSDRSGSLGARLSAAFSFLQPEILSIPEETLSAWLRDTPGLALYQRELEQTARLRAHTRSAEVEEVLAELSDVTRAASDIYEVLTNAELQFPTIKDETGQEVQVSHGRLVPLLENRDRRVREEAFRGYYATLSGVKNTIATALAAEVRNHVVAARLRGYGSALEASLHADEIPVEVYHNLIAAVDQNLPKLHRYMEIRKRALGLSELRAFDLYVPLGSEPERPVSYEEGRRLMNEALTPLGPSYMETIQQAFAQRWIDVYENQGKRSGAFSAGCYGSPPYILLNYQDRLDDAFTLAHELGHSLHSHLSRSRQPFVYAGYTTFVAEVASTVNESLLAEYLLRVTTDPVLRRGLLVQRIDDIRNTLIRQVMFAEFELAIHQRAEAQEALTVDWLAEKYRTIVTRYFGPAVTIDDEICLEWARIPHFFMNFYVFQYATGISAALALTQQLLTEGSAAQARYLEFLAGGCARPPIELLRGAGVDMMTTAPVQAALDLFDRYLDQLDN